MAVRGCSVHGPHKLASSTRLFSFLVFFFGGIGSDAERHVLLLSWSDPRRCDSGLSDWHYTVHQAHFGLAVILLQHQNRCCKAVQLLEPTSNFRRKHCELTIISN